MIGYFKILVQRSKLSFSATKDHVKWSVSGLFQSHSVNPPSQMSQKDMQSHGHDKSENFSAHEMVVVELLSIKETFPLPLNFDWILTGLNTST